MPTWRTYKDPQHQIQISALRLERSMDGETENWKPGRMSIITTLSHIAFWPLYLIYHSPYSSRGWSIYPPVGPISWCWGTMVYFGRLFRLFPSLDNTRIKCFWITKIAYLGERPPPYTMNTDKCFKILSANSDEEWKLQFHASLGC